MNIAVLDAATLGEDLDLTPFLAFGNVKVYGSTTPAELPARIADAQIIIINKIRIGAAELASAARLRLILEAATGYDNIDLAACRQRGVAVCNVVGYSANSVSQVTLAMALSLSCHLPEYSRCVSSGEYSRGETANRLTPVYRELCGQTWGVLGYGAIGRQVASVARAMGCRVLYCRREKDASADAVDVDTLCRESDILSIHTPLTEKTRGLIDRSRIACMKRHAILINVARGAVVDEAAVAEAVKSGKIGGFGSDVYTKEPFAPDHPYASIANLPNVCLTPHMAWGAYEARVRCRDEMLRNLAAFLEGDERCRVDLLP